MLTVPIRLCASNTSKNTGFFCCWPLGLANGWSSRYDRVHYKEITEKLASIRLHGMQEVIGSSPLSSTTTFFITETSKSYLLGGPKVR